MVLWVFGYGSLVWNPGFQFDEKIIGFIKDYRRVFDLACIDHRGTPEHPARTCTLEFKKGAVCWGVAYCVKGGSKKEREAMQYLERRECEYDKRASVDFYKEEDDLQPAVTGVKLFISTPDKIANRYYLGPAPLEEIASELKSYEFTYNVSGVSLCRTVDHRDVGTIATANGPCGNNREYLFSLEKAMFHIGHTDDYVVKVANEVRRVLGISKEKKTVGARFAVIKPNPPLIQLVPLHEAAVMDSR